jgi:hypothetical protein
LEICDLARYYCHCSIYAAWGHTRFQPEYSISISKTYSESGFQASATLIQNVRETVSLRRAELSYQLSQHLPLFLPFQSPFLIPPLYSAKFRDKMSGEELSILRHFWNFPEPSNRAKTQTYPSKRCCNSRRRWSLSVHVRHGKYLRTPLYSLTEGQLSEPTQAPKRATGTQQTDSFYLRCGFGSPSVSIISPIMSNINHLLKSAYKLGRRTCCPSAFRAAQSRKSAHGLVIGSGIGTPTKISTRLFPLPLMEQPSFAPDLAHQSLQRVVRY